MQSRRIQSLNTIPGNVIPGDAIPGMPTIIIQGNETGASEEAQDAEDAESIADATELEESDPTITDIAKAPFLKRFTNWLS